MTKVFALVRRGGNNKETGLLRSSPPMGKSIPTSMEKSRQATIKIVPII